MIGSAGSVVTEKASTGTYADSYTVKAAMGDGTVQWNEAVPGVPVFGDEQGDLVVALGSDEVTAYYISGLARVAGPDSAVPWRYNVARMAGHGVGRRGFPRPGASGRLPGA